ncbi:unnamed protein product [Rotaria magnacalcarata]|uniref:Uncharacterized protein n=2 Tax=Rotaria magnacalcarata TaxID=392030 RepID=A0A816NCR2_9BILA|nr:unnamed protein product [Rotaria magnacalcarata]CAF2034052.1 unnamed protein product [Rotaria magnacalcarata]CAF2058746.1 unnamed protein product [Rotaria magnacalcarata]CAF2140658.1 unnamed protein product [Rotaria magnacalcarata]CAF3838242.1 unnamed protein product [Rotaria magnacalcarata]
MYHQGNTNSDTDDDHVQDRSDSISNTQYHHDRRQTITSVTSNIYNHLVTRPCWLCTCLKEYLLSDYIIINVSVT